MILGSVNLPLPTVVVIGVIVGSAFSVMAMGIVALYKATRVPNFAFGATATFVALFHYEYVAGHQFGLNFNWWFIHIDIRHFTQLSFWEMLPISLLLAGVIGWLIERIVMRPFAEAPAITLVIVSLGLMIALQGFSGKFFGLSDRFVTNAEAPFPRNHTLHVLGVYLTAEQIGVFLIALALASGIFWFFARTRTGLAIRALSSKRDAAELCGVSAHRLAVGSWVAGTVLAGLIGVLLSAEQVTLNPTNLTLTSVVAFAAAVIGGMSSLPITFAAGIAIGVLQELVVDYYPSSGIHLLGHTFRETGMPSTLTVLLLIVLLMTRPSWIFRSTREEEDSGVIARAPGSSVLARAFDPVQAWRSWRSALGMSWFGQSSVARKFRWVLPAFAALAAVGWPLLGVNHDVYGYDAMIGLVYLMLALSVVVLTGWVGQISLAQGAFIAVGGIGTLVAVNSLHLPFPLPVLFAALFSIPFSLLIGIPSLRLRGLYLAIATLVFGYGAERLVEGNLNLGHGGPPAMSFLGLQVASDLSRYYLLLGIAALVVALCWRVSRTRPGRALYAVRDSERVAAAYGVNVARTKLTGFVLAGAVAAVGGSILTYAYGQPGTTYIDVFFSTAWLANTVVMGITAISGAFLAAGVFGLLPLILAGPVSASSTGSGAEIVAGALTILIMMINPGGLASMTRFMRRQASVHGVGELDRGAEDLLSGSADALAGNGASPAHQRRGAAEIEPVGVAEDGPVRPTGGWR